MAESIIEYINLVFKVLRYTLISLNSIVIIGALYFMISGNGLGGEELQIKKSVLIVYCLVIILTASAGIVGAIWWGKKTKVHINIILGYVISALVLMVLAIILSVIYVRNMSSADVVFTVFSVIISFLIVNSSLGFAYSIKKTKVLRRLNVVTA